MTILTALLVATILSMLATLAGCVTFIATYRPVWPWHHGVYGRNLLLLCWCLAVWIGVALSHLVLPMPVELALSLQLAAFCGIGAVVWQRVALVPRARREAAADECPQCHIPDSMGGGVDP